MMTDQDFHDLERRKFALDKAVATAVGAERPEDIVSRAEAFDAFLSADKPSEPST